MSLINGLGGVAINVCTVKVTIQQIELDLVVYVSRYEQMM